MAFLAYYLFVLPLSYLPMGIIYLISDVFYVISLTVFPYRKEVILKNLRNSFPEKSEKEIQVLKRKFYRHFADLLAEGIKNLSISEKELRKRMRIKNPEILEDLYAKKRGVLLVSGHYNNWEWLITSQNFLLPHQAVGIGIPLTSKFWDKKINERRSRFGMVILNSRNVREYFADTKDTIATLVLGDQASGDTRKAYWMKFLNQETGVQFGCEMLAHTYDQAVVFFITRKVKRGHYEIEFTSICENPHEMNWGDITEKQTHLLEKEIQTHPEFWVWSHKRWKRQAPDDLDDLKKSQKDSFNKKFKSDEK